MDSGLIVRTNARTARTGGARPQRTALSAIATDLSPAQTVTASASAPAVRNDAASAAPIEAVDLGNIVLDAQSREVVYRALDVGARPPDRRTPAAISRRLKAYTRPANESAGSQEAQTDLKV
jgi:hypothetical protein